MEKKASPSGALDEGKLFSTILYLLRRCGSVRPGLTSLLKMVYFADYWHYQKHLSSITGAQYVACERGPVIEDYWQVFESMEGQKLLAMRDVPMAGHPGHPKMEYLALVEPDKDLFSETELEVLNDVIHECGWDTGVSLSDRTHREGPWSFIWDAKKPNRPIPYIAFRWLANLPDEGDVEAARAIIAQEDVASQITALNGIN